MRLTTRARYALRLMLDVARNGEDGTPVSLASVSERTGISRGYLEQLALGLRNSRLVRGVAGRYGGYKLSEPASDITIGQIVEAAIGPICLVDCLEDPTTCPRADFCECRIVYALINERIAEVLREYTLADLLDPSWLHDGAERTLGEQLLQPEPIPETDEETEDQCPMGVRERN
jgi:Rrf2 family protein